MSEAKPTALLPERCPFCSGLITVDGETFTVAHVGDCFLKTWLGREIYPLSMLSRWNTRAHSPAQAEWLPLDVAEIRGLIDYNVKCLNTAPCDESARYYRRRVEKFRALLEKQQ